MRNIIRILDTLWGCKICFCFYILSSICLLEILKSIGLIFEKGKRMVQKHIMREMKARAVGKRFCSLFRELVDKISTHMIPYGWFWRKLRKSKSSTYKANLFALLDICLARCGSPIHPYEDFLEFQSFKPIKEKQIKIRREETRGR